MSHTASQFANTGGMNNGVFDYQSTLNRLGGDVELFTDLVRFFLEDADGLLGRFHGALERGDAFGIESAAHAIKGLCANFAAERAVRAAAAAEEAAEEGRISPAELNVPELDAAVTQLKTALMHHLAATNGG